MDPAPDLHYSALPTAIGEQLGEEMAILNVETGIYSGLKGVGVDVWKLLERSPTLAEIVEHITCEYEVDESRCRADVLALLGQLQEARLVKAETADHA